MGSEVVLVSSSRDSEEGQTYQDLWITFLVCPSFDDSDGEVCDLRKSGVYITVSNMIASAEPSNYRTATATPAVPPPAMMKSNVMFAKVAASIIADDTRVTDRNRVRTLKIIVVERVGDRLLQFMRGSKSVFVAT